MRWKYVIDETAEESRQRPIIKQKIAGWWRAFAAHAADIDAHITRKQNWDLPKWIHENLNPISHELMWEFGPGLLGGHRLVITPESNHELRPLVDEILSAAPKIPNWEFYPYRLPSDFPEAETMVKARGGARLSDMRFVLQAGKFNRVDIHCLVKSDFPKDLIRNTAFIAIENLLGEEMLDHWIGNIENETVPVFPSTAIQGDKMLDGLRTTVAGIVGKLPAEPWIGRMGKQQWSLLSMEPKKLPDYPGRQDQLTQISPWPDLHQSLLIAKNFHSARFSRCGETFAYLKIDGSEGLPAWGFQDRGDIENALSEALEGAGCGAMIGGGNGLRYCYVDLALLDVSKAIPVIREALARGGVSPRSWLFFSDCDYAAEWVGIYPESPAPIFKND